MTADPLVTADGAGYRFPRFRRRLLMEDFGFQGGPRPGEVFPELDVVTTDGGRLRKDLRVGRRPMLMVFASYT